MDDPHAEGAPNEDGDPYEVAAVIREGERRSDRVEVVVRRHLTYPEAAQLAQALIDIADFEGAKG